MVTKLASQLFNLDTLPAEAWMNVALRAARFAYRRDEVPVGAAVFDRDQRLVSLAHNRVERQHNALAHAEILVIQRAMKRLHCRYLDSCCLVVSLEPCCLCAAAIREARIPLLIYGAGDEKGGCVDHGIKMYSTKNVRPPPFVIAGIRADESAHLLKSFFKVRRNNPSKTRLSFKNLPEPKDLSTSSLGLDH